MEKKKLSKNLQANVRKYLDYIFKEDKEDFEFGA